MSKGPQIPYQGKEKKAVFHDEHTDLNFLFEDMPPIDLDDAIEEARRQDLLNKKKMTLLEFIGVVDKDLELAQYQKYMLEIMGDEKALNRLADFHRRAIVNNPTDAMKYPDEVKKAFLRRPPKSPFDE